MQLVLEDTKASRGGGDRAGLGGRIGQIVDGGHYKQKKEREGRWVRIEKKKRKRKRVGQ